MDLSKLTTLRKKLVEGTDFAKIYEYFLDNFGENTDFFDLGELIRHPMVETTLGELCRQLGSGQLDPAQLRLVWLAEHHFLHGTGRVGKSVINVIYFEEIHTGLACVAKFPSTGKTDFLRFRAQPMPAGWKPPSMTPSEN